MAPNNCPSPWPQRDRNATAAAALPHLTTVDGGSDTDPRSPSTRPTSRSRSNSCRRARPPSSSGPRNGSAKRSLLRHADRCRRSGPRSHRPTHTTSPKREDAPAGDRTRRFHPAPNAGSRLPCFPHAGGSASAYHALPAAAAGTTEPPTVQHPGRQERPGEPYAQRAEEAAAAALAALPAPADGTPTILFGHSMRALPAFETPRRPAAEGRAPAAPFVSGHSSPQGGSQTARCPTPNSPRTS